MNRTATFAVALALCTFTGAASAAERPSQLMAATMQAVGKAIASQGNAALVQIRAELKQSALETLKPLLLPGLPTADAPRQAETASAQR